MQSTRRAGEEKQNEQRGLRAKDRGSAGKRQPIGKSVATMEKESGPTKTEQVFYASFLYTMAVGEAAALQVRKVEIQNICSCVGGN